MKPRFLIHILLIAVFGLLAAGCTHTPDARLLRAKSMMTDSLPQARAMLDSIDRASLSAPDRNLRDLLAIKAADKAYVKHTADSTIMRLADYYERHQSTGRYPEALYYAGRVYSDLGDYPTALEYYHKALDMIECKREAESLRVVIISQMAYLYNAMRLYDDCIPLLQQVIEIDIKQEDTLNQLRDQEFLGNVYMNKGEYDRAEIIFEEIYKCAQGHYPSMVLRQRVYLGGIKYYKGAYDSALNILRGVPELKMNDNPGSALLFAANTYLKAGICDTAYKYAKILAGLEHSPNRKAGYKLLLSDSLRTYVPVDSVRLYATKLSELTDAYMEENGSRDALIQKSKYNYDKHDRQQRIEKEKRERYGLWLIVAGFALCLSIIVFLIMAIRNKKQRLQAIKARDEIRELKARLDVSENRYNDLFERKISERVSSLHQKFATSNCDSIREGEVENFNIRLREGLINKFKELCPQIKAKPPVSTEILDSPTYARIKALVDRGGSISEESAFWSEIEEMILRTSPDFKTILLLLVGDEMKTFNYQMALLIRCGLKLVQISSLIGKTKNAVSSRREKLAQDIFGDEFHSKPKYFDYVVLLI